MNFKDLNISDDIKKAIKDMGFTKLTPIQKLSIPKTLDGLDIIGQAQTGSGKTIAFSIPVVEKIFIPDKSPQVLILCPTRELSLQVASQISKLCENIKKLKVLAVYGGQPIGKQTRVLKKGVHIIVGTPGRVIDHINRGNLDLIGIESVVLDEADEMLEMGFREDIEEILSKTPHQRQTLLFSATIPDEVKNIAQNYQKNPVFIKVSDKKANIPKITQYAFKCRIENKFDSLKALIGIYKSKTILIFCNTKKSVNFIKKHLNKEFSIESIHGDMNQKTRDKVMNKFTNGNVNILIATDVAARGLDIDDIDVIVNYDVPQNFDDYTHRIGRTARAGKSGLAFTFVCPDENSRFNNIRKENKLKIIEKNINSPSDFDKIRYKTNLNKALANARNENLTDCISIVKDNVSPKDYLTLSASLLKLLSEK